MDQLKLCRACLSEHSATPLFTKVTNNGVSRSETTFADAIMQFTMLKVIVQCVLIHFVHGKHTIAFLNNYLTQGSPK